MKLIKPDFWVNDNILSIALTPLSFIYKLLFKIKYSTQIPYKSKIPVICVGNVTIGGTGKTPLCIHIAETLLKKGYHPAFLSRGFGGKSTEPLLVDNQKHFYTDVGDEPLILSKIAPAYISRKRSDGIKLIEKSNCDIVIMDDGLQNNSIYKNISLLVVDGLYGFGNKKLLPSGPMREELNDALNKTDAVIIIGKDNHNISSIITKPIFHAKIISANNNIKENKYLAFAGIGNPQKFYNSLKEANINVIKTLDYPDHFCYSPKDIGNLLKTANSLNAKLITTEKDFLKIPSHLSNNIDVFKISIEFDKQLDFINFIEQKLKNDH